MNKLFLQRVGNLAAATFLMALLLFEFTQSADSQELIDPKKPATSPLRGQMVMRISEDLLERLFARNIDKRSPVDQWVLGTHARGKAHTVGRTDVDTERSEDKAAFRLSITGESYSRTVGHNGPAIIQSRTVTNWKAIKRIRFDGERFTASPGTINSDTTLTPLGVTSTLPGLRGRLVRRIASRRVCECKSTAERINQKKTSQRILAQVNTIVDSRVEELNRSIRTRPILKYLTPMLESKAIEFSTENQCIRIAFAGGDSPLAAVCPLDRLEPSETELWVHVPLLGLPDAILPNALDNDLDWLEQLKPNFEFAESEPAADRELLSGLTLKVVDDWIVLRSMANEDAEE